MIEDKEIGELWRKAKLPLVKELIRKLVRERAKQHFPNGLGEALNDFDIDPATWDEAI